MFRRQWLKGFASSGVSLCGCGLGCRSAPMTGRKQLLLLPEDQEIAMGQESFTQILSEEPLSTNVRADEIVRRVGMRLASVAGRANYAWDFRLLASSSQNAFCLPGGKVAVYEGIVPVCQNEAGLAVVMSHEISHALARHGGERISQKATVRGLQSAVEYAISGTSNANRQLFRSAYGAAAQYGFILPYSRRHESEADQMGIDLMSRAGYDPSEAPRFWTRFGQVAGSTAKPPEWASTHPSDARRASDLMAQVPAATQTYLAAPIRLGLGESIYG
jgi:predicted Zn-dependent protease